MTAFMTKCKSCGIFFPGYPDMPFCPRCERILRIAQDFEYTPPKPDPLEGWVPRKKAVFDDRVCKRCGCTYTPSGAAQKYCKDCAVLMEDYWNKNRLKKPEPLGNSDLTEIPSDNYEKEINLIRRERRKIGF